MNITLEPGEKCQAKLRAEVPPGDVQSERDLITATYLQKARIPGYRPGKVPKNVVEKRFEKAIREQLENRLIEAVLREATKKKELRILEVHDPEIVSNVDLTYTVTADILVAPQFELPTYSGIQVTLPSLEIRDDHLDRFLDDWRNDNAAFEEEPEGTKAAMGHYLEIDYKASLDGEEIDADKYPGAQIYLDRKHGYLFMDEAAFLPGFCGELLDHVAGEPFRFKLALPNDFPVEDLCGKEVEYAVEIHRIQKKAPAELTDEKVAELSGGRIPSVEAFKEQMKEQLERRVDTHARESTVNQCLCYLHEQVDFELPEDMVTRETQMHVDRIVKNNQRRGVDDQHLLEQESEIVDAAARMAIRDLKMKFILSRIADEQELKVSKDEPTARIASMARQADMPLKRALRNLEKSGGVQHIYEEILHAKALDFIGENASVQTDEARNVLDQLWDGDASDK